MNIISEDIRVRQRAEEIELIMSKYKKFRFEGLAEIYVQCKKMGYTKTYDSMCKIIRKNRKRIL